MDKIGPYKVIRSIAKGGMGEVFLVYDPDCKREIALKCIRSEYSKNQTIYKRFVKEALIASKLTHPNIIPIYNLHNDGERPYYTMPYIEGKTLKQILIEAKEQQKNLKKSPSTLSSIPHLTQIFLTICEAVSYSHKQRIIHRDLKPENILIGKHGEVLIFDWGVADKIENIAREDPNYSLEGMEFPNLTSPGKIIGTLSFLAPERFFGEPANNLTDIYSLGVMLYMILTLKLPFRRKQVKEAKENIHKESIRNPIDVAPYRDIPHALISITQKCLCKNPQKRYQTMEDLIKDLRNFTEGHSEWLETERLEIYNQSHWEFSENILVSNHQAISIDRDALEWVLLMISDKKFDINTQIETKITLKKEALGFGFLINSPAAKERVHIIDGYYLWLSSKPGKPTLLFRNNVEVLKLPHIILNKEIPYTIKFEKVRNRILLHINNVTQFSYLTYLPLKGTRVGLILKDDQYDIEELKVSVASPPLIISCLDLPDAFLLQKDFERAISEYRRIGKTFPGRHESREAFFRAGLAILEQAIDSKTKKQKNEYLDSALNEFENLRITPGAPLEYLGKSLVYQEMGESQEELKCLELSLKRYPNHPLLYLIYDHIIYRLYQSSHQSRIDTYHFIFLALRYNAYASEKQMIDPIVLNLADRKKMLFYLEYEEKKDLNALYLEMIISLSFLLKKTYVYEEILDNYKLSSHFIRNILICLWQLNQNDLFSKYLPLISEKEQNKFRLITSKVSEESFDFILGKANESILPYEEGLLFLLIEKALFTKKFKLIADLFKKLESQKINFINLEEFNYYKILSLLLNQDFDLALKSLKTFTDFPHKLHFLKGCYYIGTGNKEKAHASFKLEMANSLPTKDMLASLYLSNQLNLKKWQSFDFEKIELFKQLYFFYEIANNQSKAKLYFDKWKKAKK